MKKVIAAGLVLILVGGLNVPGAFYYVDVNYDGSNGGFLGTTTAPYNAMGAAISSFTSNPGSTVYVANGEYKSSLNSGSETFGTTGYNLAATGGSWKGGYAGYTGGGTADWSTRTLPTESVTAPASTTVINLSGANSRAFTSSGYDYNLNFQGFVFRDSNVSQAAYSGGALYLDGGYSTGSGTWVRDSVFINNHTTGDGGALVLTGRGGVSQNLVFINNQAGGNGGGLSQGGDWSQQGSGTILKTSLFRNNSAVNGGGLWNMQNLDQVRFENNTASLAGGAVNLGGSQNSSYKHSTFIGNHAGTVGGAIGNNNYKAGSVTLENCLVAQNTAPASGFAIYNSGAYSQDGTASIALSFTTVAGNTGGGVRSVMSNYGTGTVNFSVKDSIIANNGAVGLSAGGPVLMPIVFNIDYNDIYGQTTAYADRAASASHPHDLAADPLFVNALGGNYQLLWGSPAFNAGLWTGSPLDDLLGVTRLTADGYSAMGAYELLPEPGTFSLAALALAAAARRRRRGP